jgi:hypothetical protein
MPLFRIIANRVKLSKALFILPLFLFSNFYITTFINQIRLNPYKSLTPLPAAIQAANNGNFLMYDFNLSGGTDKSLLKTFDDLGANEHGAAFLMHFTKKVANLLNLNYEVSTLTPIFTWYFYLSIIIAVLILGTIGLLLKTVALGSLFLILTNIHPLTQPSIGGRSLGALSTFLFGMFLFNLIRSSTSRFKFYNLLGLIMLGLLPFLREDVYATYLFTPLIILFLTPLYLILSGLKFTTLTSFISPLKIFIISFLPFVSYSIYKLILRIMLIEEWQKPFSDIKLINHGSGHSLFLGLGYTDNSYNISWSDFNGLTQAKIFSGDPYFCGNYSTQCLDFLQGLFFKLILSDPFLLFSNLYTKFLDTFKFILNSSFFSLNQSLGIYNDSSKILFYLTLLTFSLLTLIIWRVGNKESNLIFLLGVSVFFASLSLPLLVFPAYISSIQGAMVLLNVLTFYLLSSHSYSEMVSRLKTSQVRMLPNLFIYILVLTTPLVILLASSHIVSSTMKNKVLTSTLDESLNYYGLDVFYSFNKMSLKEKYFYLSKIATEDSKFVNWQNIELVSSPDNFYVYKTILYENRLILFTTLPESAFPKISLDQGKFHGGIHVCPNCDVPNNDPNFNVVDSPILFLTDLSWNGELRVVILPVDQTVFKDYDVLLVYPLLKTKLNDSKVWGTDLEIGNLNKLRKVG